MTQKFSILFTHHDWKEVNIFAAGLEEALLTARFLSANSDIRFSTVYKMDTAALENRPTYTLLCQFRHGAINKTYPSGEELINRKNTLRTG